MNEEELRQSDSAQRQHNEIMRHQSDIAYYVQKEEYNLFTMLKPKLFIDGNQWCCLYGDNIQEGIAGFGESPWSAIINFNLQWNMPIKEIKDEK